MIARSIKGKMLVFSVFFLGIVSGALLTYVWETRVSSAPITGDVKSADRAKADRELVYRSLPKYISHPAGIAPPIALQR